VIAPTPAIAVDTSALVAIVLGEAEAPAFLARLRLSPRALVGAPSALEARMVVYGRSGHRATILLDQLLELPAFEIVPIGPTEMEAAWRAFVTYGKGGGHPAGLNFGDVLAYAVAKVRQVPLLFKGDDFARTDIVPALADAG